MSHLLTGLLTIDGRAKSSLRLSSKAAVSRESPLTATPYKRDRAGQGTSALFQDFTVTDNNCLCLPFFLLSEPLSQTLHWLKESIKSEAFAFLDLCDRVCPPRDTERNTAADQIPL